MNEQPLTERHKLIDDIVWLSENPDDPRITSYDMPPLVGKKYSDESHWILFLTERSRTGIDFLVCNTGHVTEQPHFVASVLSH